MTSLSPPTNFQVTTGNSFSIENDLARAVVAAPRSSVSIFSNRCTGSRYRNALNTELFPPQISSSSLLLHVTCAISSQSSLHDPLDHLHWSLFSNHQLTPGSRSQTTPSGMPHLTCGIIFVLLFVFLISSILHHHSALLHRHALILDRLLAFFVPFSTLVSKLPFLQSLSLHNQLSLHQAHLLEL